MTNEVTICLLSHPLTAITNKLRYLSTTTDILSDEPSTIKDEVMKVINRANSSGSSVIGGGGVGGSMVGSPGGPASSSQQQQQQQPPSSSSSSSSSAGR